MPSALTSLREQFTVALQAGPRGLPPDHEFSGSSLRFRNPDGSWGAFANLQGASGTAGAAINFRDKAQLEGATVGASVEFVTLSCYATPGIGAATYRKVGAVAPADPRRIKSADNIWFRAVPDNVFDMTTLGAGQGSATQDDTALSDVITYINSLGAVGTSARSVIYYPNGVYNHTDCTVVVSRSDVAVIGQSRNGSFINYTGPNPWLKVGGAALAARVDHFLMRDLTVKFASVAASTTLCAVEFTFDTTFEQLHLEMFNKVLTLGVIGSAVSGCYSTVMRNCSGFSANAGQPAITFNHGAGFYMSNVEWYVNGVVVPVHPASQTTVVGTEVFHQNGSQWDTCQVDNCLFQFFDIAFSLTDGICINYYISNSIIANNKRYAFFMTAGVGGAIGSVRVENSWIESWESDAVLINASGGFQDNHQFRGCYFSNAGLSNIRIIGVLATNILIQGNRLGTANRVGSATAAVHWQSGQGVSILDNTGNTDDAGSAGVPWRAPYGIAVGANCGNYIISGNRVTGSVGSINVAADGVADKTRRCHNNALANAATNGGYAGWSAGALTSGAYSNTTPFVQQITVQGGNIQGIVIDSVTVAVGVNLSGTYTLDPGSQLGVTASVLPTTVAVNTLA